MLYSFLSHRPMSMNCTGFDALNLTNEIDGLPPVDDIHSEQCIIISPAALDMHVWFLHVWLYMPTTFLHI